MNKVNLKELAEQMDFMIDEYSYFVNKATGKIVYIENRFLGYAEDGEAPDNLSDWELDELQMANHLLDEWDNLIRFPNKHDLNGYGLMEDFIETLQDNHIIKALSIAISGKGAFRRFKDTAHNFGVIEQWYEFKDQSVMKFAREWCKDNGLTAG